MKLKRLLLQGYKTFASKTEFLFDDGITAVVGPNGSGKSNIADAIRWVLGEQSFSTLRGKRTTDMIFAGSQKRARAGMAQAILTLDNHDGWLPIEFSEVEICRRAYRSGENDYLLNGQKVRLMDIAALLAKAGLAEQTYTIIGQGLIDRALSLKADERRALFEEAAGISHYKNKRASTLRKLQDTQRNLQRVFDILSELKPRLSSLKRQANRAQNYAQIEADLRHLLRIWYGFQWEQAKHELRESRQTAQSSEAAWRTQRDRLLAQQEQIESMRARSHTLEEQLAEKRQTRDERREHVERIQRDIAIMTERRAALERQLTETNSDIPQLTTQRDAAAAELDVAVATLTEAQATVANHQIEQQTFEATFQKQQAQINQHQDRLRHLERDLRHDQQSAAQLEGQLNQLRERLGEQSAITTNPDPDSTPSLTAQIERLNAAVTAAQTSAAELKQRRREEQDSFQTREKALKALRRNLDEKRRDLNKTQNEVTKFQTRVDMLAQLQQPTQPLPADIDHVGRLSEFITIPDQYQTALEAGLQSHLTAQLLPDVKTLRQLITQRESNTQASVAVLSSASTVKRPTFDGAIGWAQTLVTLSGPETVAATIKRILSHILIVAEGDTIPDLISHLPPGTVAVSLDGVLGHSSGIIELHATADQSGILHREQQLREAQEGLQNREDSLAQLQAQVADLREAQKQQNQALDTTAKERRRLGRLEQEATQRTARAQRDLDRAEQERAYHQRQEQKRYEEIAALKERIAATEVKINATHARCTQLDTAVQEARATLADMPLGEIKQQRQALTQQLSAARSILDGRRAIVDSRRSTLTQFEQQITRLQTRRQEWSTQLLKMPVTTDQETLAAVSKELDTLEAEITPLQTELREAQRKLRQLESDAAVTQKTTHELENRYTQAKVAFAQHETHIENLKERIKSELGIVSLQYDDDQIGDTPLPLTDIVDQLPWVPELPENIDESIQKRRNQLRRMGAINPDAPAEFEEVQERHDFLVQQVDDLEEAEKQLRKVIAELDELTSKAFAETVQQVDAVFSQMFTRLFGGGSAQLLLTEPDDLTISGVDILARLPGRRPQGLALLSGGERSLTAASLIFALLKVSPTPFCVMDEVDAALDEANVTRFRTVLHELSQKTQFIIITHNRGTVQAARTIYGITMGDDSASQVISVKPEEYVTQAELLH